MWGPYDKLSCRLNHIEDLKNRFPIDQEMLNSQQQHFAWFPPKKRTAKHNLAHQQLVSLILYNAIDKKVFAMNLFWSYMIWLHLSENFTLMRQKSFYIDSRILRPMTAKNERASSERSVIHQPRKQRHRYSIILLPRGERYPLRTRFWGARRKLHCRSLSTHCAAFYHQSHFARGWIESSHANYSPRRAPHLSPILSWSWCQFRQVRLKRNRHDHESWWTSTCPGSASLPINCPHPAVQFCPGMTSLHLISLSPETDTLLPCVSYSKRNDTAFTNAYANINDYLLISKRSLSFSSRLSRPVNHQNSVCRIFLQIIGF